MIKVTYVIATEEIILNCEILEPSSLKLGTKQRWALSPLLFNVLLEVMANVIIFESELRKEETELSLFANDIIIY